MHEAAGGKSAALETNGRSAAQQRRAELCQNGRGDAPACRPTGRVRPKLDNAPAKVEVGTTLSGQAVTGTQVERNMIVTGNESGTCQVITGTEYIGAEQFETFCDNHPKPAATKVANDQPVSSRPITGSESAGDGFTERTGSEKVSAGGSGSGRITGLQYADAEVAARLTINGPRKVALTHTLAGRPVSGTEVGNSVKVTGDEAGSCRTISGTEYLSTEHFTSVCNTRPNTAPAKTGMDVTPTGSRITGNQVSRAENVTGDEAGSCQRVTGIQYGQSPICGGGVDKVAEMRTLAGRTLTGSRMDHGPKLTGDEHGGCQFVTGTEYSGQESFTTFCPDVPAPAASKVGISQSDNGLPVSGTMLGPYSKVTGNEPGSGLPISGTPYAGREQMASPDGSNCGCTETKITTSMEHGSRTMARRNPRYLTPADQPMPRLQPPIQTETPRREDFSILSPSREAQVGRERITGTVYGGGGRITGPVNMAVGLVSGTPEFRYQDHSSMMSTSLPQPTTDSRQQPTTPQAPPSVPRITGAGSETGSRITGDDWARGGLVTGTEGRWAHGRNLTIRGEKRAMDTGAHTNKNREHPEIPSAGVTGSSGNANSGTLVTLSGGARG